MDLNFSPDVEACICYCIVLVVGAFVGAGQIRQRIGQIEGIWLLPRTWLLLVIYIALPVILFWLLDRTSAINDTSVFAAILVGFSYERIITGGNQTIRAPGDVSQFWSPFLAYSDRIANLVRDQDARRRRRLADRIVTAIGVDEKRITALEDLAKKYSSDIKALEVQLANIADTAKTRGAAAAEEEKVRALYNVMLTAPDQHDQLREKGVIDWDVYWLDVRGVKSIAKMVLSAVVVIAILVVTISHFWKPNIKEQIANYYLWRIGKANSTANDQFRTRQNLMLFLKNSDPSLTTFVNERLASLLRQPGLPMERVDLVLQVILQSRGQFTGPSESSMPPMLVEALRAVNVDTRTRINDALKFLAES